MPRFDSCRTMGKTFQHRPPDALDRSLQMHGLHAEQGPRAAARQKACGPRAGREHDVFFQNTPQPGLFVGIDFRSAHEIAMQNIFGLSAKNISKSAGHSGTKIQTERPQHERDTTGHVLAAVLADAFNDRKRAAVAHRKAFTCAAGDEKLAGGGPIQNGVAGKNITAS